MEFSAKQIADMLNGEVAGNPDATVSSLSKIEEGKPGTLSFLANPQYTRYIYDTEASVVIVAKDFEPEKEVKTTLIKVDDAYAAFARLLEAYNQMRHNKTGVHPRAYVSDEATLGENVYVAAGACVEAGASIGDNTKIYQNVTINENVKIGSDCLIFSGVSVYAECEIGNNVTIHSGTVIGSDGFGFAPNNTEGYNKVAQIGNVILEDQVEIGENTVIASQSGVAGSTKVGKNCMIGGQVGIIGHLKIGDNVKIAAQSGIGSNVKDNAVIQGSPAFAIGDFKKSYVYFRKLPKLATDIDNLKKKI